MTRAEFLPLKSRPFVTLDYDLTGEFLSLPDVVPFDVSEAIVRVRVRASEAQAREIDHRHIRESVYGDGAYKVMPLEITIVREQRARVEGVDEQVAPLEAVAMWCGANDIESDKATGLLDLAGAWLEVAQ